MRFLHGHTKYKGKSTRTYSVWKNMRNRGALDAAQKRIAELEEQLNAEKLIGDGYKAALGKFAKSHERLVDALTEERARSAKAIEARDAYAKAMAIALKNGIFANKEQVKREIEALVELAKEQG